MEFSLNITKNDSQGGILNSQGKLSYPITLNFYNVKILGENSSQPRVVVSSHYQGASRDNLWEITRLREGVKVEKKIKVS